MNILPDLSMGGGQVVVLRHLRVMAVRGLQPMVAVGRSGGDLEKQYLDAGIELVDLGYQGPHTTARVVQRLVHSIRYHGTDIVQTHGTRLDKYLGHMAGSFTRALHVTTLHGNPPHAWRAEAGLRASVRGIRNELVFRGDWWLGRRTLRGVVAVSDAVLESWQPILRASKVDQRVKLQVIYSGIPMEEFLSLSPQTIRALRQQLLERKSGPIVLGVSRLWPGKDADFLVDMMPEVLRDHPDAVLAIAGNGPQRAQLQAQIQSLGLGEHVRMLGRRLDVPALLQAADLLVFPSRNEGFGLVALEALASALPVVCFDLPSLEKLRRDVPALQVVHEPTIDALSEQVSRLLHDTKALAELGRRGRLVIADKWNIERSTDAYLAFYERLLSAR
jgi:glycosyltransferase involved in cell wall biosynthesis